MLWPPCLPRANKRVQYYAHFLKAPTPPPHFFCANCLHSALFVCIALIFRRFKRVDKLSNQLHCIYTLPALVCTNLHVSTLLHATTLACTNLHISTLYLHATTLAFTNLHAFYTTISQPGYHQRPHAKAYSGIGRAAFYSERQKKCSPEVRLPLPRHKKVHPSPTISAYTSAYKTRCCLHRFKH